MVLQMKNKFVIAIFLGVFAVSAAAQDLDPTVEVSREYEGKLVEVHKPVFKMAVPDSLTHFALDFDYSVFANPYKGSYEFSPYLLSMKPSASDSGENTFYLRAGAGYQLHPTLDLVWSPGFKNRGFNMDVYAMHRSFVGNYLNIAADESDPFNVVLSRVPKAEDGSHQWFGYDMLSKAGVALKHDWEKAALEYSAGYYGLLQKDYQWTRGYNAVDASFGFETKPEGQESTVFALDVDYRLGQDAVATSKLTENVGSLNLHVGPFLKGNHRMGIDFGANVAAYSGAFDMFGGDLSITPHYVFKKDRFNADLGVRIAKMLTSENLREQYVYPDVNVSYVLFPKSLKVYFNATGGGEFETYSSVVASNHHITHLMPLGGLGYNIERVGLTVGFDGRVTDKFSYNVRGGYANYSSLRHYEVEVVSDPWFGVTYVDCQKWFVALDWLLDVENFRFDGTISYVHFWNGADVYSGAGLGRNAVLRPAALTGNAAVEYNWKKRIVCGVNCDLSSALTGGFAYVESVDSDSIPVRTVKIPGYVDLGVYAEYSTARNLSFWLRAGNLLNMTIQRSPLYAEKGVNFTLGICMNL